MGVISYEEVEYRKISEASLKSIKWDNFATMKVFSLYRFVSGPASDIKGTIWGPPS